MLFLEHTQVQYCKVQHQDKTLSGLIYNENLFIREKNFPLEEMETAIKECREEYLDHVERTKIPTLLVKDPKSVGIWMQNNQYKSNIIATSSSASAADPQSASASSKSNSSLNHISLRQLAMEMHSEKGVEIKTRRQKLKLYQRCFLGNEAVDWIVDKTKLSRRRCSCSGSKNDR